MTHKQNFETEQNHSVIRSLDHLDARWPASQPNLCECAIVITHVEHGRQAGTSWHSSLARQYNIGPGIFNHSTNLQSDCHFIINYLCTINFFPLHTFNAASTSRLSPVENLTSESAQHSSQEHTIVGRQQTLTQAACIDLRCGSAWKKLTWISSQQSRKLAHWRVVLYKLCLAVRVSKNNIEMSEKLKYCHYRYRYIIAVLLAHKYKCLHGAFEIKCLHLFMSAASSALRPCLHASDNSV
ncbi:hypothetical protein HELRODRAFT_169560 [Helobdella robusta]|uniref:Uncharacterized protein n=1 Tax=Helobdella robusta TaxID=6412 RepID=T1F236_HELRO|nr:hypothetical protein HELRODRAFT_169560 [Helobdella robusta]ESO07865.1 hypothetical protein HELRODRAFT_169560 [Helobdella robusta]